MAGEALAEADEKSRESQADKGETAEPAVGGEGVDIGIMGLKAEGDAEAQRPETIGQVEQHRDRPLLVAEAPVRPAVIVLRRLGAIEEQSERPGCSKRP